MDGIGQITQGMQQMMSPKRGFSETEIKNPRLFEACKGLEAYFLRHLLKEMRGSTGMMGEDVPGADIYQGMFEDALSEETAKAGHAGLARMIYRQLEKDGLAEMENNSPQSQLPDSTRKYANIIRDAAAKYGVDESLVHAVIRQESAGNPDAVSHKGAKGLMQLMDATAKELGVTDSFDPVQNIYGGVKYLKMLSEEFKSTEQVLAAYNAGPHRVRQADGIPRIRETQEYVERIMNHLNSMKTSGNTGENRRP